MFFYTQETLAKYLYRRSRPELRAGRLTRDPSQRSNSNSHSTNTCSTVCSMPHQQLRYLETDLVHLKTSKRPMVVSFKRIPKDKTKKKKSNNNKYSPSKAIVGFCSGSGSVGFSNPKMQASLSMVAQLPNGSGDGTLTAPQKEQFFAMSNYHSSQNAPSSYQLCCDGANATGVSPEYRVSDSQRSLNENDLCLYRKWLRGQSPKSLRSRIQPETTETISNASVQLFDPVCGGAVPLNEYNLFDSINYPHLYHNEQLRNNNISNMDFSNSLQLECGKSVFISKYDMMKRKSGPSPQKFLSLTTSTYKSPYDSPELSASSKQLEENLQHILEGLVLYPKSSSNAKQPFRRRAISFRENSKIMRKCKSVPSLTHLFSQRGDIQFSDSGKKRLYDPSRLIGCKDATQINKEPMKNGEFQNVFNEVVPK